MKKTLFGIIVFGALGFSTLVNAADFSWHKDIVADLGKDGRSWKSFYLGDKVVVEGSTSDANETTFTMVDPSRDNAVTVQDAGGTLSLMNVSSHDFAAGTSTWTLSTAEIASTVLVGTNAGGTVTASITAANAVQGAIYIVKNGTGQTLNFKVNTGTGTSVLNGKTAICYVNATPDVVEVYEQQ